MNNKTVFVRTAKGDAEANGQTSLLYGEAKRVFMLVNNRSTVDDLRKHAAPSLRPDLEGILEQLESDDFIRDKDDKGRRSPGGAGMPKIATPKITAPGKPATAEGAEAPEDELDFTSGHAPVRDTGAPEAGAPATGDLDFSSLVPPSRGAAEKPKAEPAPAVKPVGPAEIDFSSLVSKAGAPAPQPAPPPKPAPDVKKAGPVEVDFSSILSGQGGAPETPKMEAEARARAAAEAKARADAEAKARMRADLEAKMRAEAEARTRAVEETRLRTEADARARAESRAREEAEAKMRADAEAKARMRAELEAKVRADAEARALAEADAKAQAEKDARIRTEAEAKARAQTEARLRAELEAKLRAEAEARARMEAEATARAAEQARLRAEAEAKARVEAEAKARMEAEAQAKAKADADARARAEAEARARVRAELEAGMRNLQAADMLTSSGRNQGRSMIATVLFFDVVGYTKQSVAKQIELKAQFNALISGLIGHIDEEHRIILDTGDGAAIGFLQHPEDALDVAMKFRAAVTANGHRNYPDLKVRAGIHLGPVNVVQDMNGQQNMVGDGINDAQRIMSFAGVDEIYVSRAYFDIISRLTADSARLFKYYGTQKDKHGREHQVYKVLGDGSGVPAAAMQPSGGVESLLEDLSLMLRETETPVQPAPQPVATPPQASAEWRPMEIPQSGQAKSPQELEVEARRAAQIAADEARARAQQEATRAKVEEDAARLKAEEEAARAQQEEAARKLAADQAKAFAEAEKRARKIAEAEAKARQRAEKSRQKAREKEAKKQARREAAAASRMARPRRVSPPIPVAKIGVVLILLAVAGVIGLPNFWPMQSYIPDVEREMTSQLKQPVRIGSMSVKTLPVPRLDLENVAIGSGQQLKVGHIALFFNVLTLPANVREIDRADLERISIDAGSLTAALPGLLAGGASEKFPVEEMDLHDLRITGDVPPLPAFGGKIKFSAYGQVSKASLRTHDGKYSVDFEPRDKSHTQIDVTISDGALPMLPGIQFASLDLAGDMGDGAIHFSSISGNLYGGSVKGVATLAWQNGWQVQGTVSVSSVLVEKALPGLKIEGEMDGAANFSTSGPRLSQVLSTLLLDGTFQVKDGTINGMDIAETFRVDTRQIMPGGTHFDTLSGSLRLDSSGEHVRQIRVSAGSMSISGAVDVTPDRRLSGQLLADASKVRAGLGTLPLRLSGSVDAPVWGVGR